MWIRSQNKYTLVKCNNVYAYYDGKIGKNIIATNDYSNVVIGFYSTKEKALKVIDMIERHIIYLSGVFQMPQDDEVKDEKEN